MERGKHQREAPEEPWRLRSGFIQHRNPLCGLPHREGVSREMNNALMFSSKSDEWATPQDLFDRVNAEFVFTFDMAATRENRKCPQYYGPDHELPLFRDGLNLQIGQTGWGWCNPPYSRGLQGRFIATCAARRQMVMLLPARTDTRAFHSHIYDAKTWTARPNTDIRFLPGRLKFGGCKDAAPFPSMLVVFW